MMHPLRELIEKSRDWASVNRGRELWSRVSEVLQDTFGVEEGMFTYRKQFLPHHENPQVKAYEPWGLGYSAPELTRLINSGDWDDFPISENWFPVSENPPMWREAWTEAGIQYVGIWKLIVKGKLVGAMVLGRKTIPSTDDADLMAACSTYVSLILEMLTLRRISEHASCHDPLTNILNRRGFIEQFNQLRKADEHLVLGLLDLNDFKGINDSLGHIAGDSVLMDVAQTLRENLGKQGIAARFGGDEFVFTFVTDDLDAQNVGAYVVSWFSEKDYTVSVGCAFWGQEGNDWTTCLHVADERLYATKPQAVP